MPYLIDGHNLIPRIRGMSLRQMDDEMELIRRLQIFGRFRRQKLEVYFDKAAPGRAGTVNYGTVKAVFVPERSNADAAIRERLKKLGSNARNYAVVSSDRQVQAEARYSHAEVIPAEEFALILEGILIQAIKSQSDQQGLSEDEVDAWMQMFNQKQPKDKSK